MRTPGVAVARPSSLRKNQHKLKTPETEASGVSILMISQYSQCCTLRLPQRPTLQLSLAVVSSWLRRIENPRLSSAVLDSGSTGGQLPGSDRRCIDRLDRLRTSGLRRLFRSSDRPAATLSTRVERSLLQQGRQSTPDSHRRRPLARLVAQRRLAPVVAPAHRQATPPIFIGGFTTRLHRTRIIQLSLSDPFSG